MLGDEDLWVFYGKIQALYRFTLQVEKGDVVALIGANGAGKSTMVNTISGLIPPREGKILFAGERIDGIPPERVVEKGLIQAAEGRELFSALTVFENLMMGAYTLWDPKKIEENLKSVFDLFPVLAERK